MEIKRKRERRMTKVTWRKAKTSRESCHLNEGLGRRAKNINFEISWWAWSPFHKAPKRHETAAMIKDRTGSFETRWENLQCKEDHSTARVWKARNDERNQWADFKGSNDEDSKGWALKKEKNDKSSSLNAKRSNDWKVWDNEEKRKVEWKGS